FEPLVRLNAPRVVRLAYHFLGDWDEARDLAQEAFARAYLALDRYDPERSFGSWLCTIAARLATDRLRHRKATSRALRQEPAAGHSPVDAETRLSLHEALSRLTARERQAVVLCDLHGFTASEAAAMIGCTASTVRVLRFLARRRMRAFLAEGGMVAVEAATLETARPRRTE
ncbi:MAG TPA: sigma-70 family RNA polymerase sigma factor, partial [Candidatus Polarisedimenticolia bacterium]|nr:sigma-70 family RNA polymerase sigma factor [Candidatus Polarisedimenticolia bacterium]